MTWAKRTFANIDGSGWTNTETIEGSFHCFSSFTTPITALDPWAGTGREHRTTTTVLSRGEIVDWNMLIYWMESDLSKFDAEYAATLEERFAIGMSAEPATVTAESTSSDSSFTSTATMAVTKDTAAPSARTQFTSVTLTSSSSSVAPNSKEKADNSDFGLNARAKAGIGLGIAIAVILMGIAGFVMYRKKVQKQRALDQKFAKQNEQPEWVQRQRTSTANQS